MYWMIWVDRSDFLQQKSRALARHCTIFAYCTINSAGSLTQLNNPYRRHRVQNAMRMMNLGHFLLAALTAFAASVSGFVSSSQVGRVSTSLYGNTKQPPPLPEIKDISYGEESRRYRRTVYTHDDWRRHRSPDRFPYQLSNLFNSGIYKNLAREVAATTAVAAFIVFFNSVVGGYTDFEGVEHAALVTSSWLPILGLPQAPFLLSSPALGLLLGMYPQDIHEASHELKLKLRSVDF
jgi:hypothetical protein